MRDDPIRLIDSILEHPWDTVDLHYDAGEWSVTLHEDAVRTVEGPPKPSLLDAIRAALALAAARKEQ